MPPREYPVRLTNLTREAQDLIIALVASLVGGTNRIPEMGANKLTPDMLPREDDFPRDKQRQVTEEARRMGFVRTVLQLIYRAVEEGILPTEPNLLRGLTLEYGDEAKDRFEWIMNQRPIDASEPGMVHSMAAWLADWIATRRLQAGAESIQKIANSDEGNARDIYQRMSETMLSIAPRRRVEGVLSMAENARLHNRRLVEWQETREKGIQPGPMSPWPRLNRDLRGINRGEIILASGKTGFGKSQMAWLWARHTAWEQGGFNVALMHFEQYNESIMNRFYSEEFGIFASDFKAPPLDDDDKEPLKKVDFKSPAWQKQLDKLAREIDEYERKGHLWLVHASKYSCTDIEQEIARLKAISDTEGRELLVIYDYIDLIDISEKGHFPSCFVS